MDHVYDCLPPSINQSNFYSANIPGEARLSGTTAKSWCRAHYCLITSLPTTAHSLPCISMHYLLCFITLTYWPLIFVAVITSCTFQCHAKQGRNKDNLGRVWSFSIIHLLTYLYESNGSARRWQWIAVINRKDRQPTASSRLCSRCFIFGM